jgi:uncharacterized membrane protein YeaQ/YmgE (transglycosylase-associated protein family)
LSPRDIDIAFIARKASRMLHILWSIIVGFFVGLVATHIMGAGHLGFWMTTLVGIGGSVVGGLIARIFSKPKDGAFFHPAGILLSIVGALVVLFIVAKLNNPA